jgi:hypothetical protein
MKLAKRAFLFATAALSCCAILMAQQKGAEKGGAKAPPRPVLWVTTSAFPDGGEVPMKHAARGEN